MMATNNPVWIQTFTGKAFAPPGGPDVFDWWDIAISLSRLCRFNGHCQHFYSVAEHSVLLARYAIDRRHDRDLARALLLHDAAEAYVGDLPKPLKARCPDFCRMEQEVSRALVTWHGVETDLPDVKELDFRILTDEKNQLLTAYESAPRAWQLHPAGGLGIQIQCWGPEKACMEFNYLRQTLKLGRTR